MQRFFYKFVVSLIPRSLKELIARKIILISKQTHGEEWVSSTLIPIDQKVARLEAKINSLENYIKGKFLNEWVNNSLVPLEQKIERISHGQSINHLQSLLLKLEGKMASHSSCGGNNGLLINPSTFMSDDSGEFLSFQEYLDFEKQFHQNFEATDQKYKDMLLSYVHSQDSIIELGCGEGYLLKYLLDNQPDITVLGIDNNPEMVKQAIGLGLNAEHGDALVVLQKQDADSTNLILAIHIIEHLQLHYLRLMIENAYRALKCRGKLVIETPNIQSLYVMSHYYYSDPTHMIPRHPSLITYVLRSVGFTDVKISFSGQPPDDLIMNRSGFEEAVLAKELDEMAVKFNQLFFSAGNNVIIEAVK